MTDKKHELEGCLWKTKAAPKTTILDLLRSKIMIEVGRFDDAEKIIDRLSGSKVHRAAEAKLQKVILHLIRRRYEQAVGLFKKIETSIKKDTQFYNICLALAFFQSRSRAAGRIFAQIDQRSTASQ